MWLWCTSTLFSCHGIPEVFRSDNGLQFTSHNCIEFTSRYQICHITSSPHYPKSNVEAERMVKVPKNILKKANDPIRAFSVQDHSWPLWTQSSPTAHGRQLRTTLPTLPSQLIHTMPNHVRLRRRDKKNKRRQAQDNQLHGVSCHNELANGS